MNHNIRNMPAGFGAVEYQDLTLIHPLAFVILIIVGVSMLVIRRRWSVIPMLIIACFIPSVQKVAVFGLDFNLLRIMILFGIARLILHREYVGFAWKPMDMVVVLWAISSMLIYTLQQGTFSAFVSRLGFGLDALGMYFLFRCLIRDWLDLEQVILGFILISVLVAVFFVFENRTNRNMFSVFGGVPEITVEREGRLRCQGAFTHPIVAGCFWASLMPLFAAHWWKSTKDRALAIMGLVTSSIIVVCCASSTPVMGVLGGMIGGLMFFFRRQIRLIRWIIFLTIIGLHLVMLGPVWHLISRVPAVGGSTGYYRYLLIDEAINHFHEWALLGTRSTAHWSWGTQDITNHYILEGVRGGALSLFLFVCLIALAFKGVGLLCKTNEHNRYRLILVWSLGVCAFIHCLQFLSVAYVSPEIFIVWYLILATIGSLSQRYVYDRGLKYTGLTVGSRKRPVRMRGD